MVIVNQPPQPVIAAPAAACPGEQLAFGGGGSHDADGKIDGFAWSFGDGATADGADVTHAYAAPGLYELTLAVDDGTGLEQRPQADGPAVPRQSPAARRGRARSAGLPRRRRSPSTARRRSTGTAGSIDYRWDFGDGARRRGRAGHAPLRRARHL